MAGRKLPINKVLLACKWHHSGQPAKEICRSLDIAKSTLSSWKKTATWIEEIERLEKFEKPQSQDSLDIESRRNLLEFAGAIRPYRKRLSQSLDLQSGVACQLLELAADAIATLEGSELERAEQAGKMAYLLQSAAAANKAAAESLDRIWRIQAIAQKVLDEAEIDC